MNVWIYVSSVWFTLSVCPSVFGWNAVDSFRLMSSGPQIPFQNSPVHFVSLFETISVGRPCTFHISFTNARTTSVAVPVSSKGTKWAIFVKRSTTTIIWVFPSDSGSATMKSTEIDFHGAYGTSRGCRSPYFACLHDLFRWQASQVRTYSLTVSSMFGQ